MARRKRNPDEEAAFTEGASAALVKATKRVAREFDVPWRRPTRGSRPSEDFERTLKDAKAKSEDAKPWWRPW